MLPRHIATSTSFLLDFRISFFEPLGNSKICELKDNRNLSSKVVVLIFVVSADEDIGLFQVQMSHVYFMQFLQAFKDLVENHESRVLFEGLGVVEQLVERLVSCFLQNKSNFHVFCFFMRFYLSFQVDHALRLQNTFWPSKRVH